VPEQTIERYEVAAPSPEQLREYAQIAHRSFGHEVSDITDLRDHATMRVASNANGVVAGGLGIDAGLFFGGRAVPGVCLGAGCVAPEVRGGRLAQQLMDERIRAARDAGAVLAAMWTSSNSYVRHLGWQAPTDVYSWTVATDDLRRSFREQTLRVESGLSGEGRALQREQAAEWNGPVDRPEWWWDWKTKKGGLQTYEFSSSDGRVVGLLAYATKRKPPRGMSLQVHEFWAATDDVAREMLAFLGGQHSRAEDIEFRRSSLPSSRLLSRGLARVRLEAQAWHPWSLRLLDFDQAVAARGWPSDRRVELALDLRSDNDTTREVQLSIESGIGRVEPRTSTGRTATALGRLDAAVWFAGGFGSLQQLRSAGLQFDDESAARRFMAAGADREPWLPDLF
jgi:predicted acetyltransferase